MTYQDGYQDGAQGQPQRQRRRPYSTGYKHGVAAYEAETKKLQDLISWVAEASMRDREP
jgi:hypothetical protein